MKKKSPTIVWTNEGGKQHPMTCNRAAHNYAAAKGWDYTPVIEAPLKVAIYLLNDGSYKRIYSRAGQDFDVEYLRPSRREQKRMAYVAAAQAKRAAEVAA